MKVDYVITNGEKFCKNYCKKFCKNYSFLRKTIVKNTGSRNAKQDK